MRFEFDPEKAIEALIYVAKRGCTDIYQALKIFYVADKFHLESYGNFVFGDSYVAMASGPVPSNTYDIVKFVRGDGDRCNAEHARDAFTVQQNDINPMRDADLQLFSRSDIECLDAAIDKCEGLNFYQLKQLTHDEAYNATTTNGMMAVESIAATLPNGAEVIQHLADPHPGEA